MTNRTGTVSLPEAADLLGVSLRTVFRYLAAGRLTAIRREGDRRVYVRTTQVQRLAQQRYEERHGERPVRRRGRRSD